MHYIEKTLLSHGYTIDYIWYVYGILQRNGYDLLYDVSVPVFDKTKLTEDGFIRLTLPKEYIVIQDDVVQYRKEI